MPRYMVVIIEPKRVTIKPCESVDADTLYMKFVMDKHFHVQIYRWGIDSTHSALGEHYILAADMGKCNA